jgi:hypothetical protein
LTSECEYVQVNRVRSRQLHDALEKLTKSIREVEAVIETMRTEHDPLVSHAAIIGTLTTRKAENAAR